MDRDAEVRLGRRVATGGGRLSSWPPLYWRVRGGSRAPCQRRRWSVSSRLASVSACAGGSRSPCRRPRRSAARRPARAFVCAAGSRALCRRRGRSEAHQQARPQVCPGGTRAPFPRRWRSAVRRPTVFWPGRGGFARPAGAGACRLPGNRLGCWRVGGGPMRSVAIGSGRLLADQPLHGQVGGGLGCGGGFARPVGACGCPNAVTRRCTGGWEWIQGNASVSAAVRHALSRPCMRVWGGDAGAVMVVAAGGGTPTKPYTGVSR